MPLISILALNFIGRVISLMVSSPTKSYLLPSFTDKIISKSFLFIESCAIDEANRKIQLAKALEQYSEEAKKYLDEGICDEKDGTLTQMMRRIQAFVQEVKARGEHLNIFAIKYAI